jgi:hypothetical protein
MRKHPLVKMAGERFPLLFKNWRGGFDNGDGSLIQHDRGSSKRYAIEALFYTSGCRYGGRTGNALKPSPPLF